MQEVESRDENIGSDTDKVDPWRCGFIRVSPEGLVLCCPVGYAHLPNP